MLAMRKYIYLILELLGFIIVIISLILTAIQH